MKTTMRREATVMRVLVAVLCIGALLFIAGRDLAPGMSAATWLLWCVAAGAALAAALLVGLVVSLQIRQLVLRRGGTDVQWLAFSSDPEGLVSLRRPARSATHGVLPSDQARKKHHDGQAS